MSKSILLVHGRHFKPPKAALTKLWLDGLRFGIERDHPQKLRAFDAAAKVLVYYGDISNKFLAKCAAPPGPNDLEDRKQSLERLKQWRANQFTKRNYRQLPGASRWMEAVADTIAEPLGFFGLSDRVVRRIAPDIGEYWGESYFGSQIRGVFTEALIEAMQQHRNVCVIAHSLGTMLTYDTFWKFSHYWEYRSKDWNRKIELWITLGSPLADETVKRNLKGYRATGVYRYPNNVNHWLNVAAVDDYISHDEKVADDFKAMRRLGLVRSIRDKRIYNLAVRGGKANPHHGVGYLIHPVVAEAVATWL